jgi:hypothetical protein
MRAPAPTNLRRARALAGLVAAAACEPAPRPPEAPTPPAADQLPASGGPIAGPTPRPRTRAAVRSCPASGKPAPVDLDPRIALGEVAGATWLFGYASEGAVLARLDRAGGLAKLKVPLDAQAGAIDGDAIYLYASRQGDDAPTRWLTVDAGDPDAPQLGAVEALQVGATVDYAAGLGVGAERALVITGHIDARELVVLDRRTRSAVTPPHPLGGGFLPVHTFCDRDRCAVIGVADEGGGPARRLVVIRALADGTREQEQLAPGWIGQPHAAELGDSVIVAWPGDGGLFLRALDRWGRPRGPAVKQAQPDVPPGREALLHADGAVALAIGGGDGWSFAPVAPDATVGKFSKISAARRSFLLGAPLDDGLAWIDVGGDVDYSQLGDSGAWIHSWRSAASAGFVPASGAPPVHHDIAAGGGGGRGGFDPYMLVRPGTASALVVPRGDADGFEQTVLAPLRIPCGRSAN